MRWAGLILGSYLLGAVSFSYLLVWFLRAGVDIRRLGSGNAGATNVLRTTGAWPALLVLVLDLGKGVAAVVAARLLNAPPSCASAAALAAVIGHIFPIYTGFRGGKGVATAAGAMGVLTPLPTLLALLCFGVVVVASRYVSAGSIVGCGLFPLLVWVCGRVGWIREPTPGLLLVATLIAGLIVSKHWDNVIAIRAGREWKLGDPRDGWAEER